MLILSGCFCNRDSLPVGADAETPLQVAGVLAGLGFLECFRHLRLTEDCQFCQFSKRAEMTNIPVELFLLSGVVVVGRITGRERVGGQEFHISDAYVWTQIHYLDSPTDYGEYLPGSVTQHGSLGGEPMILLDEVRGCSLWNLLAKCFFGGRRPTCLR